MRKTTIQDNLRRLILILAMTSLLISLFAPFVSAAEANGTCGGNLSWTLSDTGVLTVSGTGTMENYSELYPAPWYSHRNEIRTIILEEGVTSIGNRAFRELENVISVKFPSTLKTIGKYAFVNCTKLKMISFSEGLETIRESAFENCEALMSIRLPETLKTLDRKAFYLCSSLKAVEVPAAVTSFGDLVFSYCTNLVTANIKTSVDTLPIWTFYGCEQMTAVYLAENITSIGAGAFENCPKFFKLHYGGSEEQGANILTSLDGQNDKSMSDYVIYYREKPLYQGEIIFTSSDTSSVTTSTNNVITTENATISTTVTTKTEYTIGPDGIVLGDSDVNVTIDAVVENEKGWDELFSAIQNGQNQNVDRNQIDVDVTLKDSSTVTGGMLNQFVGRDDLNLNIDMQDGSSVQIDCGRLEYTQEEQENTIALTYRLSHNPNPTKQQMKTIGNAQSYLLSFDGTLEMDFSPKIYLGQAYSYKTATLYQYIPGRGLSLLQSVIVDKSGYAMYYLSSTKESTQYLIALDVQGVDSSTAIIPEDIAKDYGEVIYYDPIEYVVTGVRLFMGLSLFQFAIAVFCAMLVLFVGVGIIMSILYRKKKLEAYYQMLRNQEEGEDEDGYI